MYKMERIIKWSVYGIALFVIYVIQLSFADKIRILGIAPNLLAVTVAVLAVLEGPFIGAGFGLAAGLMYDAAIYGSNGFFPVILMLTGIVIGGVSDYIFKKNFLTAMFWTFAALVFINMVFFMFFFLFTGRAGPFAIITTVFPEALYSLAISPAIYYLYRILYMKVNETS